MAILVTGGAGYIGSHTVKYLLEKNQDVVVVDNLQSGHKNAIEINNFYEEDIRNRVMLDSDVLHLKRNSFDQVWYNENIGYKFYLTPGFKFQELTSSESRANCRENA